MHLTKRTYVDICKMIDKKIGYTAMLKRHIISDDFIFSLQMIKSNIVELNIEKYYEHQNIKSIHKIKNNGKLLQDNLHEIIKRRMYSLTLLM